MVLRTKFCMLNADRLSTPHENHTLSLLSPFFFAANSWLFPYNTPVFVSVD